MDREQLLQKACKVHLVYFLASSSMQIISLQSAYTTVNFKILYALCVKGGVSTMLSIISENAYYSIKPKKI